MLERLFAEVEAPFSSPDIRNEFVKRIQEGNLTQTENAESHFCVYFAAFDPVFREVFIGHHKEADMYLFTGGHMDLDESPKNTVEREIWEEWGMKIKIVNLPNIELITVTKIESTKVRCRLHYDLWFFIPVNKKIFNPDREKLLEEFHSIGWLPLDEARQKITDPATLEALTYLSGKN